MEELIISLEELDEKEHSDRRFAAAMQGVDIDEDNVDPLEEARKRRRAKELETTTDDVIANSEVPINSPNGLGIGYEQI